MKFYNKEVNLPDVLGNLGVSGFRLLTVSTSPLSAGNVTNNNYEVYYYDGTFSIIGEATLHKLIKRGEVKII